MATKTFADFAGQAVKDGIGTNSPLAALEEGLKAQTGLIAGMVPKISSVLIEDVKIFGDPFAAQIGTTMVDDLGVGAEIAGFQTGAANKLRDGTFPPSGQVPLVDQVNYINYSYNINVTAYDREIKKSVISTDTASKYLAEKLKTPLKTMAINHYLSWKQIISDVCDGTKSINSKTQSDGSGNSVVYNPLSIKGYCGTINKSNLVIAKPVIGALSTVTGPDALLYVQTLEGISADFKYECSSLNVLAVETFVVGKPLLIAETKVLNALDVAWTTASTGYKGVPTVSAREALNRFCDILEIDVFPDQPINVNYPIATDRIAAILMDPTGLKEIAKYGDVETFRNVEARATTYNFQGESILAIWAGANSYCLMSKLV